MDEYYKDGKCFKCEHEHFTNFPQSRTCLKCSDFGEEFRTNSTLRLASKTVCKNAVPKSEDELRWDDLYKQKQKYWHKWHLIDELEYQIRHRSENLFDIKQCDRHDHIIECYVVKASFIFLFSTLMIIGLYFIGWAVYKSIATGCKCDFFDTRVFGLCSCCCKSCQKKTKKVFNENDEFQSTIIFLEWAKANNLIY